MEEKEHSGVIGNPEILSTTPPDSPATDVSDKIGSASRDSLASEEKKPALSQRLTEAFREGVASANPDYEKRPEVKPPPLVRNIPQVPGDGRILDRVIQGGGSAAAVVVDKASNVLGAFVQLVKKAPALTQKYAEAFREGAASVKSREGKARPVESPTAAKENRALSGGRAILDRVFKAGESAVGFVRESVAVVNSGKVIGARQNIRMCKKRINNLYIDIGNEAVNSWSDGLVETEKLAALLDELRKNEEEILNLQAFLAEVAAARKTGPAGSPQTVRQEAALTPETDQEDSRVDAGDSGDRTDKPVDYSAETVEDGDLPQPDEPIDIPGDLPQPENRREVAFDVADMSVSALPDSESPESKSVLDGTVDAKAVTQEEASGGTDQAMPGEPEASQEKAKRSPPDRGAVTSRTSKRKGGRR